MTLAQHARHTLAQQIRKLDEQLCAALAEAGEDAVHDFRVAVRHLAQSLRLFAPLCGAHEARRMRRALKPALAAAAVVRDLDVDVALLIAQGLAASHPLIEKMRAERARAADAFIGQLYLLRSRELPLAWLAGLDALVAAEDASEAARLRLPALWDAFWKAGAKAAQVTTRPERLHVFRLEAKRFRYSLEVFRPFYGPVCDQRVAEIRQIQDLLGKRQDCAVTVERLRPLAALETAQATLLRKIETRARRLEAEFRALWTASFAPLGEATRRRRYLARRAPLPGGRAR